METNQQQGVIVPWLPDVARDFTMAALASGGAQITQAGKTVSGSFVVQNSPNVFVAVLLFFLCIVPGIIYLIVESKNETLPFHAAIFPHPAGSVVMCSGPGAWRAYHAINYALRGF